MRLLMAAIGGVVVLLAGLVALSVAGPSAAYIAAALAAVYPNLWMNDGLLMAESLAVAGTAAAVWCTYRLIATWRRRWAAATGAACAVAMLSRSELALLVPVMVPAVLFARTVPMSQRLAHAGLACATAAFVVAPWVVYNLGRFEEPVVLSHGDGNVLSGSNCDATYHGTLLGFHNGFCGFIEDLPAENSLEAAARRRAARLHRRSPRPPACGRRRPGRPRWGCVRAGSDGAHRSGGGPAGGGIAGGAGHVLGPRAPCGTGRSSSAGAGQPLWPLVAFIVIVTFNAAAFYGLTRFRAPAEVSLVVLAAVAIARLESAGGQQSPDMLSRPHRMRGRPHRSLSTSTVPARHLAHAGHGRTQCAHLGW